MSAQTYKMHRMFLKVFIQPIFLFNFQISFLDSVYSCNSSDFDSYRNLLPGSDNLRIRLSSSRRIDLCCKLYLRQFFFIINEVNHVLFISQIIAVRIVSSNRHAYDHNLLHEAIPKVRIIRKPFIEKKFQILVQSFCVVSRSDLFSYIF